MYRGKISLSNSLFEMGAMGKLDCRFEFFSLYSKKTIHKKRCLVSLFNVCYLYLGMIARLFEDDLNGAELIAVILYKLVMGCGN